ncbi:MAG: hypothetical protein WBQ75_18620 [Acetobacteraceae bacterium]
MPLAPEYTAILEVLAEACSLYRQKTGHDAVLVGGAATAIYTDGAFPSGDFDFVTADDAAFRKALRETGFRPERRAGHLLIGFYHPNHPQFGVQQVSGSLFEGRTDKHRMVHVVIRSPDAGLTLPPIEDLIADRLAQHAVASPSDTSRLLQAQALFRLAHRLDKDYLQRRVHEEGGDLSLLMPP